MYYLRTISICTCIFLILSCKTNQPKKNYGIYNPATKKQQRIKTWENFNKNNKLKWKVTWNPITGTPHRISGYYINISEKPTEKNIKQIAAAHLQKFQKLLQIDPKMLVLSKKDFDEPRDSNKSSGTWYLSYRQVYQGLPVYGSCVRLIIRNQKITLMGSDFFPDINISPVPKITKEKAIQTVQLKIGKKTLSEPMTAQLIILPNPIFQTIRYHLAWRIITPILRVSSDFLENHKTSYKKNNKKKQKKIPVQWCYYIDAINGNIIKRSYLLRNEDLTGNVTGMIRPTIPADTPEEVPIPHMTLNLTQGTSTYTTTTDSNGDYTFTGLNPGNVNIEAQLTGPHVIIFNVETNSVATHTASLMVPDTPIYNWNWSADDPSPNDVETNIFYHVNWIHNWYLQGDPFDINPDPYPMRVWVRNYPDCNAFASPGGLFFESGIPGECEDFGLCADVIYHEYTHLIVFKIYPDEQLFPYRGQTGAMNEGWCDYFGNSIVNNPVHCIGCYLGRDIDSPDRRFPDDYMGRVHNDGMIFSGSLWDLRSNLGSDYVDRLALRSMKRGTTSFSEYLVAVLREDDDPAFSPHPSADNNPTNGTPNIDAICHCFGDKHGIYHNECFGHTENPIAIITSPPILEIQTYTSSTTSIEIIGTAYSGQFPFKNFIIDFAPFDNPTNWQTTGISLTNGGSSEVAESILAIWDLTGIPDGIYHIRLTVSDDQDNIATAQVSINIDRLLADGWQQNEGRFGPVAVGNVDPDTEALEVVCTSLMNVYVFHADGSLYGPWPIQASDWLYGACPALGDLDGDGDIEIVIGTEWGIQAWHHDGTEIFYHNLFYYDDFFPRVYEFPVLSDLDKDGDLEIILGKIDGNLYIFHHDGSDFSYNSFTWPKATGGAIKSTPALADLDGDSELEIVVGSEDGYMYAWNLDGSDVDSHWPIHIGRPIRSSPAIGDIDNRSNHDLEVVIGSEGKVYAWHQDGTPVSGNWPVSTPVYTSFVYTSPGLADLNGNGDLEILIHDRERSLEILKHDGSRVSGWNPPDSLELSSDSPIIGDLNGDFSPEIIIHSSKLHPMGSLSSIFAFQTSGVLHENFPRLAAGYSNIGTPVIADLDHDGYLELILGTTKHMNVWRLPNSFNHRLQEWPTFHHDMKRTGFYGPHSGIVLLFDTSSSMKLDHNGISGVPVDRQRLTLAKRAAIIFMYLTYFLRVDNVNFGLAALFSIDFSYSEFCLGYTVKPLQLVNRYNTLIAVRYTIPGLTADGSTPLLSGIENAMSMFGWESKKSVVLLSDGYHNCPSHISPEDPLVNSLIDQLNEKQIRIFTIGFGLPTDPDHPLLEMFANQTTPPGFTGSQFYDVTTSDFDPDTWNAPQALVGVYKNILTDILDLDSASDPRGTIYGGRKKTFEVNINEHDHCISFFLSWETSQEGRLGFIVKSSDGQMVSPSESGIEFQEDQNFKILTVNKSFLRQPDKIGPNPWKIEIDALSLGQNEKEQYQYSVILKSDVKLETGFDKKTYYTGDTMTITANITELGKSLVGLKNVSVEVVQPKDGIGNWYSKNKVNLKDLTKIPEALHFKNLSKLQRKTIYLNKIRKVTFPGNTSPKRLLLFDNGTHGDIKKSDGIYTNQLSTTSKEGTYFFYINVSGPTSNGNYFDRDDIIHKYVKVNAIPEKTAISVNQITAPGKKFKQFKITLTPRDELSNYLGPRHPGMINLKTSNGKLIESLQDNLDGTYSQLLEIPESADIKDINIVIGIKGKTRSFNLAKKLKHRQKPDLNN